VRLEYQRRRFDAGFTHLLCHQKARIFVGEQYGRMTARPIAAAQSLL
jgi:hypothetical protein